MLHTLTAAGVTLNDSVHDYKLWQCALCGVVCHYLDHCGVFQSAASHCGTDSVHRCQWFCGYTLLWLRVRKYILERRPSVVSPSHSRVPTKLHESSLCGESGWLLSCDYSLTHRSQTPSHSSSLTPSFHLNHRADLGDECLAPEIPLHFLTVI